jgi:uncharacterized damage-inducible protein DinB
MIPWVNDAMPGLSASRSPGIALANALRMIRRYRVSPLDSYLDDLRVSFRKQKDMAEKALGQVADTDFFRKPGEFSNSIAAIVKHVGGNLASRWTDFLTADGEKPWRDRDAEFVIGPNDTRERLGAIWQTGWSAVSETLAGLSEGDLLKQVCVRGEPHTVFQAIHRSLTHTAYHTGQIVYLARLLTKDGWQWITIPPGQSKHFEKGNYLK